MSDTDRPLNEPLIYDPANWTNIDEDFKLKAGMLVKGYTYSVGDFHLKTKRTSEKSNPLFGDAKQRIGIIIDKIGQEYFKVVFWSHSESRKPNEPYVIKIPVFLKESGEPLTDINTTESYCLWVNRHNFDSRFVLDTVGTFNLKEIFNKNSKRKKNVEMHYMRTREIYNLSKEKCNEVLKKKQFRKDELKLRPEWAKTKAEYIIERHIKYSKCVDKELNKVSWLYNNYPEVIQWNDIGGKSIRQIQIEMLQEDFFIYVKRKGTVNRAESIKHYKRTSNLDENTIANIVDSILKLNAQNN